MDAERSGTSMDLVALELCEVVRDVVNERHAEVACGSGERLGERTPQAVGEHVTVGTSVVRRGGHRSHVMASLRRLYRDARQLPVGHPDPVRGHRTVHRPNLVCADLMADAPRTAVDHDDELPFEETE